MGVKVEKKKRFVSRKEFKGAKTQKFELEDSFLLYG
jgi:hypothetical protein